MSSLRRCSVKSCISKTQKYFFPLPEDTIKEKWLEFLGDSKKTEQILICKKHFCENDFEDDGTSLKSSAVPHIYNNVKKIPCSFIEEPEEIKNETITIETLESNPNDLKTSENSISEAEYSSDCLTEKPQTKRVRRKRKARNKCTCEHCQTGSKPGHKCSICYKVLARYDNLKFHMMSHNNDRPFKCTFTYCDKEFSRPDLLKKHMRVHTQIQEKFYQCGICDEKFQMAVDLCRHFYIHRKNKVETLGAIKID